MKINLVEIAKINNNNKISKYKINKPLFLENYLFHYLILTNNLVGLKLKKHPIHNENDENMNGLHLAAKYNNLKILNYLIKQYPEYVNNRNSENENFLHFLNPNTNEYFNIISKNNLDWSFLFNIYSKENNSPLDILFSEGNKKNINHIVKNFKLKYYNYENTPAFFNLILNNNMKDNELIELLKEMYKNDNKLFSYTDIEGNNFLYPVILDDNLPILKYLFKLKDKNIKFDSYSPLNTYNIFSLSYNKAIINQDYNIANFIIDKIISEHNFNETNKNGDNLAHFILKNRMYKGTGNDKIEDKILSHYDLWDKINIDKKSALDYISMLDFKKYSKYLKGKKINKNYNTKNIKNNKWKQLIDKLEKYEDKININFEENKYSHGNLFQARFSDIAIFFYHLNKKYKNLYLPRSKEKVNIYTNINLKYPDELLKHYNNFLWVIVWNDKDNYLIHPNLNQTMKKNKNKYDYSYVLLSLRLQNNGLHAALIFYDFKNNIIERFDPYGNTMALDKDMDIILEKELTKGNEFKYYAPNKYFPVAGFQTISDENNKLNQKMGDFGGYCLAWCLWYIEHRMKNIKVQPKTLIRKTLHKFMELNIKPNEYIRNYANEINKYRVKWLINHKVPKNDTSDEVISLKNLNKIKIGIIEENEKLN